MARWGFSLKLFICAVILIPWRNFCASAQADTTVMISQTKAYIVFPSDKYTDKNILVLPGWNFACEDICQKSNFCSLATNEGFVLVMPDMQKSVYASQVYPETRPDWLKYHTRRWITDTLIPYFQQNFKIFLPNQKNYLLGISTGGRGVALLACYDSTHLFRAGAALSGDFDQTLTPNDNLMKGFYGNYQQFPLRWEGNDNPARNAFLIRIPLYLAHGTQDNIVPYSQSEVFYHELKKYSSLPHQLHLIAGAKHDYVFWASQYSQILLFFNQH